MLSRKITISVTLFVLIIILGGIWNFKMVEHYTNERNSGPDIDTYSIYSARYRTDTKSGSHPFAPREYIRIIQPIQNEPVPYELQ